MLTGVVVPARDEAARLPACLAALQAERPDRIVVVDDASGDTTAEVALRGGARVVTGTGGGPGPARRLGFALLRAELGPDALLLTTDADSVVQPGWLAANVAAVRAGAGAVGGRIVLDPAEAAALPAAVLHEREAEAAARLVAVRAWSPDAEHHQLSGASLALTAAAHDAVDGIPALPVLEDEALERALRAAGVPIAYTAAARVVTSARTEGRVRRGLAQVLRTASWAALQPAPGAHEVGGAAGATVAAIEAAPGTVTDGRALRALLDDPATGDVVCSGPPALAEVLRADPSLVLVKATGPAHPLDELLVRPLLALEVPDLAAVRSPAGTGWAARTDALRALRLPASAAVHVTVLVDLHAGHGLAAIAEAPVDAGPQTGDGTLAYAVLAALRGRTAVLPASSRYGTARVALDELEPVR